MVQFTENAIKILEKRYLLKDEKGNIIETPDEMLVRVANVVCKDNEKLKTKILEMMRDLRFLPNTPTLMNAGTTNMLSACFVIDVDDTLESIVHDAGWQQAYIHKMGGGVGINFSKLRPKGDLIKRTGGVTSGVMGFLEVFNVLSEVIRQGGKRDGANMGILNVSHPEIENWINAKIGENKHKFRNFNLSVLVTDKFMEAVEKDLDWNLIFPDKVGMKVKIYKTVKAKYLFDMICKSTWECGCPGLIFVDEINRYNPLANKGMWIETTNPCWIGDTRIITHNLKSKSFKELVDNGITELDIFIWDEKGKPCAATMKNIKLTRKNCDVMRLYLNINNDNNYIECTEDHNLYVVNKVDEIVKENKNYNTYKISKMIAKDIKIGDFLYGFDDKGDMYYDKEDFHRLKIVKIEKLKDKKDVYNGYVEKFNRYFVSLSNEECGILSANCGEIPAYVGMYNGEFIAESCNLGSLNLSKYIIRDILSDEKFGNYNDFNFDFDKFKEDIKNTVEFLDMVIDANEYPFLFIDKGTKLTRKIGLGITGLSECLIKLKMVYGSDESLNFIKEVMSILNNQSHSISAELGNVKGFYPLYEVGLPMRRNLFTTACAPTGTIGRFMLGHPYSGGIEPPPAIDMSSYIIDSKLVDGTHPLLVQILKERAKTDKHLSKFLDNILERIRKDGKSIQKIEGIPNDIKRLFLVAEEIPIETHIKVQALIQEHTDNAVSKTINMKNESTIDDVSKAFMLAWKSGCKGVTVYRDNSKDKQVFETTKETEILSLNSAPMPRRRYKDHICIMREIESACGVSYNGITFDFWGIMEDFPINSGKGGCIASQEAIGRSVSTMLRNNISPEIIIKQYHRVKCNSCLTKDEFYKTDKDGKSKFVGILSCADGISQLIKDYYGTDLERKLISLQKEIHKTFNTSNVDDNLLHDVETSKKEVIKQNINERKKCPDCGAMTIRQEGCMNDSCPNCGWGGCV